MIFFLKLFYYNPYISSLLVSVGQKTVIENMQWNK